MNIKRICQFIPDREQGKPDAKLRYRIKWENSKNIVSFNVGYRVDTAKWSAETQRCKNNTTHGKRKVAANIINKEIQRYENTAFEVFSDFEKSNKIPNTGEFRKEFNKKIGKIEQSAVRFFDVFDEFMSESGVLNSWTEGTRKRYAVLRNKLEAHNPDINLNTLSQNDLISFMRSMFNEGLHNTTVAKKISDVKVFLRWANKNGYYDGQLHNAFSIRLKGTDLLNEPVYLEWDELIRLYNLDIPDNKKCLVLIRDVFCFCCFTSLRYSDVAKLTRADVKENHIVIVTQKTAENIKIELNKYSRAILEKYRPVNFKNDLALPVISNQKMNDYVKELCQLAGFDEMLKIVYFVDNERKEEVYPKYSLIGTHCGRRTFIVNSLYLGIPAEVVMKWTGHADYSAMKPYIKIVDKLKQSSMKKFDER
jgi:integrase